VKSIFAVSLILSASFTFAAAKTKKEEAFNGTQEWSQALKDKPCFAAASKQALQVSLSLLPFQYFYENSLALESGSFNDKTKIYFFDVVTRKNNRANYGEPAGGTTIMAKVLSDKTCDISATPKPNQSKE
jgi:hypothetical protein